jgi:hypothetical protein
MSHRAPPNEQAELVRASTEVRRAPHGLSADGRVHVLQSFALWDTAARGSGADRSRPPIVGEPSGVAAIRLSAASRGDAVDGHGE